VEYKGRDTNIFGKEWSYDHTADRYFWRIFCETDFTDAVYDGVDFYDGVNGFRIKTRQVSAEDLKAEQEKREKKVKKK
jgi:hypothetical protein